MNINVSPMEAVPGRYMATHASNGAILATGENRTRLAVSLARSTLAMLEAAPQHEQDLNAIVAMKRAIQALNRASALLPAA